MISTEYARWTQSGYICMDSNKGRKREGYEALTFINTYADQNNLTGKAAGHKIEVMLNACKSVGRGEIILWIKCNW